MTVHRRTVTRLPWLLLSTLVYTAAAPSCSIKEDRTPCPCYLTLLPPDGQLRAVHVIILPEGSSAGATDADSFQVLFGPDTTSVHKAVRRTFNRVSAYDARRCGSFVITPGRECDSLYAFSTVVDCTCDEATQTIGFHKQFATLYIEVTPSSGGLFPEEVTVEGEVCGVDPADLTAVEGPFRFRVPLDSCGRGTCRLPRQRNGAPGLVLTLRERGSHTESIPLGEVIASNGFDWSAPDLGDISVLVDALTAEMTLRLTPWQEGLQEDVEI